MPIPPNCASRSERLFSNKLEQSVTEIMPGLDGFRHGTAYGFTEELRQLGLDRGKLGCWGTEPLARPASKAHRRPAELETTYLHGSGICTYTSTTCLGVGWKRRVTTIQSAWRVCRPVSTRSLSNWSMLTITYSLGARSAGRR